MNIENLEALNEMLESKNREIYDLKEKVEKMTRQKENAHDRWDETCYIPRDDFRKDLPVPRLEMIYWSMDRGSAWTYGIVRLAHSGMRESWDSKDLVFIPLSQTTTTSEVREFGGKIDRPFRDSGHFSHDIIAIGLPGYITCPDLEKWEEFKPMEGDLLESYNKELLNEK